MKPKLIVSVCYVERETNREDGIVRYIDKECRRVILERVMMKLKGKEEWRKGHEKTDRVVE